ncbi:hypothetical protein MCUN1_002487 [Malassezia cuniculi]|uniref:Uncharacterized protein n=1 Tax=Malassezia cuniculi TaxID=948313 RepID=A0AAF0EW25_9BASI|nr:hypothetical protein MCUN1_002487 [Malassezia cuniculi]
MTPAPASAPPPRRTTPLTSIVQQFGELLRDSAPPDTVSDGEDPLEGSLQHRPQRKSLDNYTEPSETRPSPPAEAAPSTNSAAAQAPAKKPPYVMRVQQRDANTQATRATQDVPYAQIGRRQDVTVVSTVYSTRSVSNSRVVTLSVSSTVATHGPPTAIPTNPVGEHHSGTNKGAVAGGVVGGVVGAALIAALAIFLWRRRKNARTTRKLDEVFAEAGVGGGGVDRRARQRNEGWDAQAESTSYPAGYPPIDQTDMTPMASFTSVPGTPSHWQSPVANQTHRYSSAEGLLGSPAFAPFAVNTNGSPMVATAGATPTIPSTPATYPVAAASMGIPDEPTTPIAPHRSPSLVTPAASVARTAHGEESMLSPSSELMWLPRGIAEEQSADGQATTDPDSAHNDQEIANRLWRSPGTLRVANAV